MKRRALVLLFTCGLLLGSYPGKMVTITTHVSNPDNAQVCKRCYHTKKDHYSGTGMCMQFDGCPGFVK
jgi:hypothetical protein